MFNPCFIIPVFDHAVPLQGVLERIRGHPYPRLVIDDGSGAQCRVALAARAEEPGSGIILTRLEVNGGKGAAVKCGLRLAHVMGFTHAIQLDADGQHDADDLPALLSAAACDPGKVICGVPVFDASVPFHRHHGRRVTNFWVRVNACSRSIPDAMCGLRVYPVAATITVLDAGRTGNRMEFDPEILVRLAWAGVGLCSVPVRVRYPHGGVSHFRMLEDNLRISWMHTRLFFGMLWRMPSLLRRGHG